MAKKKDVAAEATPAVENKYPGLSTVFMGERSTFKGRLKSVYDSFQEGGIDHERVKSFRQALQDGAIPGPTERVTPNMAKQCAALGIGLPEELLPEQKAETETAATETAGEDLTSAVTSDV